jgi:hypothetical protein
VYSIESRPWNVDALFFMLGRDQYGFVKKDTRTCYAKGVFLHPVGSAGYVVHSGASGAISIESTLEPVTLNSDGICG